MLNPRDWSRHTLFEVNHQPDQMTVRQLEQAFRRLLSVVYSVEATARRGLIRRQTLAAARG